MIIFSVRWDVKHEHFAKIEAKDFDECIEKAKAGQFIEGSIIVQPGRRFSYFTVVDPPAPPFPPKYEKRLPLVQKE
jgi:hypothetical protein